VIKLRSEKGILVLFEGLTRI